MDEKYPRLFEPAQLGNITLKNRFIMAPMSTCDNLGFHMYEPMLRFVEERAKNDVAMIMTECQAVAKIDSMTSMYKTAGTPEQEKEWKTFNDRVKKYGAKTCCQLGSGAGRNTINIPFGNALSCSKLSCYSNPKKSTIPMTVKQIHDLVASFGKAAAAAKRAGFDAVEIHAHTGYLLDQFVSECFNHRTDEYGGSAENRARICSEIIEEIRRNVGEGYPVLFRISMDHKIPGNRGPEESAELIRVLDKTSVTAFDVDYGCYGSASWGVTPDYYGDGAFLPAAAACKKCTSKPVMCAGTLTPELAEKAIEDGTIDFAMIGRQLIADPEFIVKVKEGRQEDVRPCLRCNNYCICHFFQLLPLSCAVNPEAAAEDTFAIQKTAKPEHYVVIGGGPAGMEAAVTAAKAGHSVDLYDKGSELGGQILFASQPPFKGQMAKLLAWFKRETEKSGVRVHLGAELTPDSPELAAADRIIVALGAHPVNPPIPGIDKPWVVEVTAAHTVRKDDVKGENIVVLGGGFSGCEYALELAMAGKSVTVVEMGEKLAPGANFENRHALLDLMTENGVTMLTGTKVVEFTDAGVAVEGAGGRKTLPCDTAINALGSKSNDPSAFRAKYPAAAVVGDCVSINLVGPAIHSAYEAVWLMQGDAEAKKKILKKKAKEEKFRLMVSSITMPGH